MPEVETLAEALPKEQARVRVLLEQYQEVQAECGAKVNCHFAINGMKRSLALAEQAAAAGDVVRMIWSLNDLRHWEG